jgi:hypothetical protein
MRAPDRRNRADFPRWRRPNAFPVINHRIAPAGDAGRWAATISARFHTSTYRNSRFAITIDHRPRVQFIRKQQVLSQ